MLDEQQAHVNSHSCWRLSLCKQCRLKVTTQHLYAFLAIFRAYLKLRTALNKMGHMLYEVMRLRGRQVSRMTTAENLHKDGHHNKKKLPPPGGAALQLYLSDSFSVIFSFFIFRSLLASTQRFFILWFLLPPCCCFYTAAAAAAEKKRKSANN